MAGVSFEVDQAVAWSGRTQVFSFTVAQTAEEDRVLPSRVETAQGDATAEVIRDATVLAGQTRGYVRIKSAGQGGVVLHVGEGEAASAITLSVEPPRVEIDTMGRRPRLVSPAPGAVVWGESIGVAAMLFDDPLQVDGAPREVRLRLPHGEVYDAVEATGLEDGPTRWFGFELQLDAFHAGDLTLIAEAIGKDGQVLSSEPLTLQVIHPDEQTVISDEAEALKDEERPQRYRDVKPEVEKAKPLNTGEDESASGGAYVANFGSRPAMAVPVTVEEAGWYQVMLSVSGTPSAGLLPTIGVRIDDNNDPSTTSPIALGRWHRTPVGHPLRLEPGDHYMVTYFENDENHGKNQDRNLRIDRYEVCRLPDGVIDDSYAAQRGLRFAAALPPELDGQYIGGELPINAVVYLPERQDSDEQPRVSLLVNGQPVSQQYSGRPRFVIDRAELKDGDNTLQLTASLGGGVVRSAEHTVHVVALSESQQASAVKRQLQRFYAADPAWDKGSLGLIRDQRDKRDPVVAFYSNATATLTLPESLAGEYDVVVDMRGDSFEGPPMAEAKLLVGDASTVIGESKADGNYSGRPFGRVTLAEGPKAIAVSFTNDHYGGEGKKDRNLYVRYVELRSVAGADTTAPAGRVLYPSAGQSVFGYDAVIVEMADDRGVATAQLQLDGEPWGDLVELEPGTGRALLPLVLRDVSAGEHQVSVALQDRAGNASTTAACAIAVPERSPQEPGAYERAVRLLDRFAYGPEPRQVMQVLLEGQDAYIHRMLTAGIDSPGDHDAWTIANYGQFDDRNRGAVARRCAAYLMKTTNPVRGRSIMWIDNHFNTWMRKTEGQRKAIEFDHWVRLGPAAFFDLLEASASSPAMLRYLDQQRSFKGRINENYAREIMELHTLGVHGGYAQDDVTQLAHLLTGWSYTQSARPGGRGGYLDSEWAYLPTRNDPEARVVFGMRFDPVEAHTDRYDRVRLVLETLASHPSTARFISQKLAQHYLTATPSDELIERLAEVYLRTSGDLAAVIEALATSPEFEAADAGPRLAHPLGFGVRLQRLLGESNDGRLLGYTNRSGFGIFDRETPDGYPQEDEAYADSNAMLQRWRYAQEFESSYERNVLPRSLYEAPKDADEATLTAWRQQVVDALAMRLTGRLLSERSNAAVMQAFAQATVQGGELYRLIGTLVAQMPESSLR